MTYVLNCQRARAYQRDTSIFVDHCGAYVLATVHFWWTADWPPEESVYTPHAKWDCSQHDPSYR